MTQTDIGYSGVRAHGEFTTVAYFQNALRSRLAPGNIELRAR